MTAIVVIVVIMLLLLARRLVAARVGITLGWGKRRRRVAQGTVADCKGGVAGRGATEERAGHLWGGGMRCESDGQGLYTGSGAGKDGRRESKGMPRACVSRCKRVLSGVGGANAYGRSGLCVCT